MEEAVLHVAIKRNRLTQKDIYNANTRNKESSFCSLFRVSVFRDAEEFAIFESIVSRGYYFRLPSPVLQSMLIGKGKKKESLYASIVPRIFFARGIALLSITSLFNVGFFHTRFSLRNTGLPNVTIRPRRVSIELPSIPDTWSNAPIIHRSFQNERIGSRFFFHQLRAVFRQRCRSFRDNKFYRFHLVLPPPVTRV